MEKEIKKNKKVKKKNDKLFVTTKENEKETKKKTETIKRETHLIACPNSGSATGVCGD